MADRSDGTVWSSWLQPHPQALGDEASRLGLPEVPEPVGVVRLRGSRVSDESRPHNGAELLEVQLSNLHVGSRQGRTQVAPPLY